jgi:DDE superfamily endonuclease
VPWRLSQRSGRRSPQWSAIKKAKCERRTLVWVDEAGFYLLSALVRTWAPIGKPAILRAPCSYDHLSAISAITPSGQLLLQVQEEAYHGVDVVRFLKHVLRHIPGKLLILWDGASIHRSQAIKDFLAAGAAKRIHLERLPGYASDIRGYLTIAKIAPRGAHERGCHARGAYGRGARSIGTSAGQLTASRHSATVAVWPVELLYRSRRWLVAILPCNGFKCSMTIATGVK